MGAKARKAWSVAMSIAMALSMVSASAPTAFAEEASEVAATQLEYDNVCGIRNVNGETLALMEIFPTDEQLGRLDLVNASGEVVRSEQFSKSPYSYSVENGGWYSQSQDVAKLNVEAFNRGCFYYFEQVDGSLVTPVSYDGERPATKTYTYVNFSESDASVQYAYCCNSLDHTVDVLDANGKLVVHVENASSVIHYGVSDGVLGVSTWQPSSSRKNTYYWLAKGVWTIASQGNVLTTYSRESSASSGLLALVEQGANETQLVFRDQNGLEKIQNMQLPDGASLQKVSAVIDRSGSSDKIRVVCDYNLAGERQYKTFCYTDNGELLDSIVGSATNYVELDNGTFTRAKCSGNGDWVLEIVDATANPLSVTVIPSTEQSAHDIPSFGVVGSYIVLGFHAMGLPPTIVFNTAGAIVEHDFHEFWEAPFGGYFTYSANGCDFYDDHLNLRYTSAYSCSQEFVTLADGQIVSPSIVYGKEKEIVFRPAMSVRSSSVSIAGYQIGTCSVSGGLASNYSVLNQQLARDNGNFIYACDADGKYGAIDAQGNVRLSFEYDAYFDSGETDSIMVEKDGAWSFLDLSDVIKKDPVDISTLSISAAEFVYDGKSAVSPVLTVKDGDKPLAEGVDYEVGAVEYDLSAGTGAATVVGLGDYAGSVTVSFTVAVPDALRFPDVAQAEWYFESCAFAKANGLISGYEGGDFGPGDTLTRAQAAAILQRYFAPAEADSYDAAATANETGMDDVAGACWYTGAANWAVREGVINGKLQDDGSRLFDPDGVITREQLCAIVGNAAAKWCGAAVKGADRAKLYGLLGSELVSDWAVDSVAWGVNEGVINGVATDAGRDVAAGANVERSVMAAVMMNAIQNGVIGR